MSNNTVIKWGCCNETTNEDGHIDCVQCKMTYHYVCVALDEQSLNPKSVATWVCPECVGKIPKESKTDNTPARNVSSTRGNKRPALNSPPVVSQESSITRDDVRDIVQEIMKTSFDSLITKFNGMLLSALNSKLAPLQEEIAEMKSSMIFMNETYEKMLKEQEENNKTIKEVRKENDILKATVTDLTTRLNHLEQHARSRNIEIQCVPEKNHENIINIVTTLGKTIGFEVTDADVHHCTRVAKINPSSTRPRTIVVQFATPRMRDSFLAKVTAYNKANSKTKLNATNAGLKEDSAIYVSEHLTPALKDLHYAVRTKAKKLGYNFVWIRNGRIFVRKSAESEYIWIKDTESLVKIV